jgi:hypothetical protein
MADPTIICVTGMGRCGTSLVARVLNLLGASLGPADHLMGPAASNLKGHWENEPLVALNDELLAFFGGRWDEPPTLAPGWHRSPALASLREKARAIIEEEFAGLDRWAWKDPRSSVTMPFWQNLLPPMKYIVCLRNPLDVASSLLRRDGYSIEKSGRLWLTYTASAIAHTSGRPRLLMFYEDLMDDWQAQVGRLVALLGRPRWPLDAVTLRAIGEFVDHELDHHRTAVAPSLQETGIPFAAQALHLMLRGAVGNATRGGAADSADAGETDASIDIFSRLCVQADSCLGSAKDEAEELLERLARMAGTVEDQDQRLQALTAQLTERRREKDQALESLSEKLQAATVQRNERERQVAGMEQSVSWRWTRPLRQAKRWIRSLIGRRGQGE